VANLVLAFAEMLGAAVLLDAAIKGDSITNVVQGKATQHPLTASSSTTSATPATGAGSPVPAGSYTNPVPGAATGRIDQGVDYTLGPKGFLAPGRAKIVAAQQSSSGWGGGGYVAYQLLDGPLAGTVGYIAENIAPAVGIAVGQVVGAGQQIAVPAAKGAYGNGAGSSEAGWANPASPTQPLAQTLSGYNGDQSVQGLTAGYSFSRFVSALGGAAGQFQGAGAALLSTVEGAFSGSSHPAGVP
jgi:hypothetical protein